MASESLKRKTVQVTGTVSHRDGLETGVVVNGITALVYNGEFVANHFLSSTESNIFNIHITEPGIYSFVTEVADQSGEIHSDTVAILAMDRNKIDILLQTKWEGMKANLLLNKIDDALDYFLEGSQIIFREQFNIMESAGLLHEIVGKMGAFRLVEHDGYGIIYDLRTEINGEEYSFQVLFVQEKDGIWRIKNY